MLGNWSLNDYFKKEAISWSFEFLTQKLGFKPEQLNVTVFRGEGKEGVGNLMTIYSCVTGKTDAEIEREFDGRGYADFKLAVGEAVADRLAPVREEYARLLADKGYLEEVMKKGSSEAAYYARKTLSKVRRKLGFVTL